MNHLKPPTLSAYSAVPKRAEVEQCGEFYRDRNPTRRIHRGHDAQHLGLDLLARNVRIGREFIELHLDRRRRPRILRLLRVVAPPVQPPA